MGSSQSNAYDTSTLTEGDIVVFHRSGYKHYGIYIGNDEIVHFTGTKTISDAMIKRDNIWKVANGCKFSLGNRDKQLRPVPNKEVVQRALSKLGDGDYSLFWSNCEHFVNWCRYGIKESDQVDNLNDGMDIASNTIKTVRDVVLVVGALLK